jgi:hypothetical protein
MTMMVLLRNTLAQRPARRQYISNPFYVSVGWGSSAQTVTLGASLKSPPMSSVVVDINPQTAHVAAIGSGAGPTAVVFTPVRT